MCWSAAQLYACDDPALAAARGFADKQLSAALLQSEASEDLIYDAILVTSELLTNCIRAGAGVMRLRLMLHRDRLRIAVDDDAPGQPVVRTPGSSSDSGRGLAIVESIASHWAVERLIPGKQVWAELDVPPELTADLPSCHQPTRFSLNAPVEPASRLDPPLASDNESAAAPTPL